MSLKTRPQLSSMLFGRTPGYVLQDIRLANQPSFCLALDHYSYTHGRVIYFGRSSQAAAWLDHQPDKLSGHASGEST